MKTAQVVDLRDYFSQARERNEEEREPGRRERILWGIQRAVESASSLVIALCVVVCTLVFLTML